MIEPNGSTNTPIDLQKLWDKYEDIAMHFNDLLMRLRSQSIAGVAALATLTGVLAKAEPGHISVSWFVAAMIFVAMGLFWIAVWCLDFLYYNRLLRGAVAALCEIEAESQKPTGPRDGIRLSTLIEAEFGKPLMRKDVRHFQGVLFFYLIVLFAIVAGITFSLTMHWTVDDVTAVTCSTAAQPLCTGGEI